MHDKVSFRACSERIAAEARRIALAAAEPVEAGETVKAQMRRAWANLGRPSFWRLRAAWYGEAGCWSAAALEEFRARYRSFCDRQERQAQAAATTEIARLASIMEALRAIDPDFHRDTIAALERAVDVAGRPDRALASRD